MRYLVTGGFGFIGGHLIERLVQMGQVHVVDNLSTNPIPYDVLLDELGRPANLTYDLVDIADWQWDGRPFDVVFHLASPVGPAGVLKHGGEITRQVVRDTYTVIDVALTCGAKLVDVSTSEVYGGGKAGFCKEDMPKIVPSNVTIRLEYATAKLAAEVAIINTCTVAGLDASIVRPFNVAGPRQSGKGGFVLPRFIEQAINGQPLTVFGNGQQIRAFTHVYDIVEGICLVAELGGAGEAYNLGNPRNKLTILELAKAVNQMIGNDAGVTFVDPRDIFGPLYAEAADKYPHSGKAINELGWDPRYGVAQTISTTCAYMRQETVA